VSAIFGDKAIEEPGRLATKVEDVGKFMEPV
jgi:hypothetical protein